MLEKYKITSVTSEVGLDELRPVWEAMQWHPGADFEFFKLILQSRKTIISPCILVASENGRPVALLAGRIETAKLPVRFGYMALGKIPIRRLVVIEGGFMGVQTEELWQQFLAYSSGLLVERQLNLAMLEQIQIASPRHAATEKKFGRMRLCLAHSAGEHWLMQLPGTWDEFLKCRSKKHRYWLKRLPAVLDKEFSGRWRIENFTSEADARRFINVAEQVASLTYQRGLGVGFQLNAENLARVEMEARRGQLRGYVLFIDNKPKTFWYCFIYNRRLYLAATGYDPAFRDYEVGTVLLMKIFQDHCGTDVGVVDFGLGDAGYKKRFGSEHYMESSFYLFPKTARGLGLNLLHSVMLFGTQMAKGMLNRLRVTQFLKTRWRRKLERPADKAGAAVEAA